MSSDHRELQRLLTTGAVLSLLLAFALLAPAPAVDNRPPSWFPQRAELLSQQRHLQSTFGADEPVLVEVRGRDLPAQLRFMKDLERRLAGLSHVQRVVGPGSTFPTQTQILSDPELGGLKALPRLEWSFKGPFGRALGLVRPGEPSCRLAVLVRPQTNALAAGAPPQNSDLQLALDHARERAASQDLQLVSAGQPIVGVALDRAGREVKTRSLPLLAVTCVLLLLALTGSPTRTLALIAPAGLCVAALPGVAGALGVTTNLVVGVAEPLVFVLVLGSACHVGVAFEALEEEAKPTTTAGRRALAWEAARHKRSAIALALGTTGLGFLSLSVSEVTPVRTLGWLSAAGCAFGVGATQTLVPLALGALPRWSLKARNSGEGGTGRVASWLFELGQRRAPPIAALAAATLALGIAGAFGLEPQLHALEYFPAKHRLRQDHGALAVQGVGLAQVDVLIKRASGEIAPIASDAALLQALDTWSRQPRERLGVRACLSLPLLLREASYRAARVDALPADSIVRAVLRERPEEAAAYVAPGGRELRFSFLIDTLDTAQLEALRTELEESFASGPGEAGLSLSVGGSYDLLLRTQTSLVRTLVESLLLSALLMQLVLIVALRSWRLCLAAFLPNALPVAAILIVLRHSSLPLDVGTCMTAAVALGIAVDDTLHVLLGWRQGSKAGALLSGRALVLSTLVISAGFLALYPSTFLPTRAFGLLCALALAVALLGDLLVLPACLRLVGALGSDQEPQPVAGPEAAEGAEA